MPLAPELLIKEAQLFPADKCFDMVQRTQKLGSIMKKIIIAAAALAALSSCAKRPDAIVPVDIPMAVYQGQNCQQLGNELIKEQQNLAAVSKAQNEAATGDAVGVFLIGVPMSSAVGGDKEGQVAVAKGKVQAIENTLKSKGCN